MKNKKEVEVSCERYLDTRLSLFTVNQKISNSLFELVSDPYSFKLGIHSLRVVQDQIGEPGTQIIEKLLEHIDGIDKISIRPYEISIYNIYVPSIALEEKMKKIIIRVIEEYNNTSK
jgi:hypothetical protein